MCEKILSIIGGRDMKIKSTMRYHCTYTKMAEIENTENTEFW